MNLTIFDLPDEIIIKIFNARLSFHGVLNLQFLCPLATVLKIMVLLQILEIAH